MSFTGAAAVSDALGGRLEDDIDTPIHRSVDRVACPRFYVFYLLQAVISLRSIRA